MNENRKKKRVLVDEYFNLEYLSIDEAISKLEKAKRDYSNFEEILIEFQRNSYDEHDTMVLRGDRWENDNEMTCRIASEKECERICDEHDRKIFEELKKKFGE